jgi:hypothetical protein
VVVMTDAVSISDGTRMRSRREDCIWVHVQDTYSPLSSIACHGYHEITLGKAVLAWFSIMVLEEPE